MSRKDAKGRPAFRAAVGAGVGWVRRSPREAVLSRTNSKSKDRGAGINLVSGRPKEALR